MADTNTNDFDSPQELEKYFSRIEYYKEKRKKYTLIETGKEIGEAMHISMLNFLNGKTNLLVNLLNKYTNLIENLDSTNKNLIELYEIWEALHPNNASFHNTLSNNYYIHRFAKLQEYIIFDLHQFISQTIATTWVLKKTTETKLKIYDIGSYLNEINKQNNLNIDFTEFELFHDYIQTINNIFNASKHSFAYNDSLFLGLNEIIFFAINVKDNNFSKTAKCHYISLEDLITTFNEFYEYSKTLIDQLTQKETDN